MGFREKFLDWITVEVEEPTDSRNQEITNAVTNYELPSIGGQSNSDSVNITLSEDIVSEAYSQFVNTGFNLFKVEELYANFDGIPEDTKITLVRKNLGTLGIDLVSLIDEAVARKATIDKVKEDHVVKSENYGKEINSQIADAKTLIDELSAKNIERKNKIAAELAGADAETKRLEHIIKILGGA